MTTVPVVLLVSTRDKDMKTMVARDSNGQIMWVKGRTDISPMAYREWKEGEDMLSGKIVMIETGQTFIPPFTLSEEEIS